MKEGGNVMKRKLNKFFSNLLTFSLIMAIWLPTGVFAGGTGNSEVDTILVEVVQILLAVAGCVCLGKLVHIGIIFLTAGAAEKSNAKMALVPWVVGTVVCFGASWIGNTIINIIADGMKNKDVLTY